MTTATYSDENMDNTRPTVLPCDDELVERVARAISPHVWRKFDQQNRSLSATDLAARLAKKKASPNTLIGQSIGHARAAIEAMSRPAVVTGEGQGWQSIESAPKDGTRIIVWIGGQPGYASVAQFRDYRPGKPDWRFDSGAKANFIYWQPLPEPPAQPEVNQ